MSYSPFDLISSSSLPTSTSRLITNSTPSIFYDEAFYMSEESHSQWYSTHDPTDRVEECFGSPEAELHPIQQYQARNLLECHTLAPLPSTPSSWEYNFNKGHYVEQPHHPPEAYQYGSVYADNISPAQWSNAYEFADEDTVVQADQLGSQKRQRRKVKTRIAASLPEGQPRSKRAERRAQVFDQHGSVSATDQPRGKTRVRFGVLEWFDPKQSTFHIAAPLDEYRHQIISEDSAHGEYDYTPDKGLHEDDVTAFPLHDPLGQQHWNLKDRNAWVDIKDEDGNQVLYLVEKPDRDIEPPDPGFMVYNNLIMLDPDDNPIIDWPGLPRCLASTMEGARIEALRRIYPWLSLPHFRARMPRWVDRKTMSPQALFGLSSLQQRLTRFREIYDCPPWKRVKIARGASLVTHTRERLAREGRQADSTAGLEPLTRREVLQRKKGHFGRCPENVGLYTLTEDEREEKVAREAARHDEARAKKEEAQVKSALRSSTTGTKRKHDHTSMSYRSIQPFHKQARSALGAAVQANQQLPPMSAYSMAPFEPAGGMSIAHPNSNEDSVKHENSSQKPDQDHRWVAPETFSEQISIKAALSYTVADFKYYHAMEPPATTATYSYFEQYRQIQDHHQENWSLEDEPAPQLIYIGGWFGSFRSVPLPDADEENMKRLLPSHLTSTHADAETSSEQHQVDTNAVSNVRSEQHHANTNAVSDLNSHSVSDWLLETDYSQFLEDGVWDAILGLSVPTSPDQVQADT